MTMQFLLYFLVGVLCFFIGRFSNDRKYKFYRISSWFRYHWKYTILRRKPPTMEEINQNMLRALAGLAGAAVAMSVTDVVLNHKEKEEDLSHVSE